MVSLFPFSLDGEYLLFLVFFLTTAMRQKPRINSSTGLGFSFPFLSFRVSLKMPDILAVYLTEQKSPTGTENGQ